MKPQLSNNWKTYKGRFFPRNIKKYIGKNPEILYRSRWELKFCEFCDNNPNVIKWNSEEIIIPYIYEIDQKQHRYFMDFYIEYYDSNRKYKKALIEVKPYKETIPPKKPKRKTKKAIDRYLKEELTYKKNINKWQAATKIAQKNNIEFIIMDEHKLKALKIL